MCNIHAKAYNFIWRNTAYFNIQYSFMLDFLKDLGKHLLQDEYSIKRIRDVKNLSANELYDQK